MSNIPKMRHLPTPDYLTQSDTKHFRGPMALFIWQLSPNQRQRHQQLVPRDGKGVQQRRELRGPPPSSSTPALRTVSQPGFSIKTWGYTGDIVGI